MALMINGKKVVGYALGDTEFYSIDEHADGSITYNGHAYDPKTKISNLINCTFHTNTTPCSVSIGLNQILSYSTLTVKDLIDKGRKIRLALNFYSAIDLAFFSLNSGIIDLSKPDSNGHFNFQWVDGAISTNTYCYPDSSANKFNIYSDALNKYTSSNYDGGRLMILYPDES